jgi:pimeloyl-ACP methyl ester carboxylesterase
MSNGRFARRGSRRIAWAEEGDGPPLVLLPGIGSGRRLFGTLPRRFARNGFRAIAYDPIGIPPSSEPFTDGFSFDTAAEDVWAVVDDAGLSRVSLVATSLGGKVALTMAAGRPDRVERLVLLASAAVVTPRARRVYKFFEIVAEQVPPDRFGEAMAPFLFGSSFLASRPSVVDDIIRATRPAPETRRLMAAQARALQSFDGVERARRVRCPTLCAAGAEDTLTTPAEVRATADLVHGARYLEFPRAGHSLFLEDAAVFEAVADFLHSAQKLSEH